MQSPVESYRALRDRVDRRAAELLELHGRHIVCRAGCFECCVNLTVFPVEYSAILEDLARAGVTALPYDSDAECGFLKAGRCVLYDHRPLICRTHGLPIAFENSEASPPEMSVSFCPLNFNELEDAEFGPDNTLNLDEMNGELFAINLRFIQDQPDRGFEPTSRIRLSQLVEEW